MFLLILLLYLLHLVQQLHPHLFSIALQCEYIIITTRYHFNALIVQEPREPYARVRVQ